MDALSTPIKGPLEIPAPTSSTPLPRAHDVIDVAVANHQSRLPLDEGLLGRAVRMILEKASIRSAQISVAVVDDPTIRRLHEQYLALDEPTDVLSFVLESSEEHLDGEVIVSADTAAEAAPQFGLSAADELLLYVIHGTLHLVGYDDTTPQAEVEMRREERACLAALGVATGGAEMGTSDEPSAVTPAGPDNNAEEVT